MGWGLRFAVMSALVLVVRCSPPTATSTPVPSSTLVTLGKITASQSTCSLEAGAPFAAGRVTFLASNPGNVLATFVINKLMDGHTYADIRAHAAEERRLADAGEPFLGPPPWAQSQGMFSLNPGETATPSLTLLPGTYAITCLAIHPRDQQLRVVSAAGPLEVR
jgi:hypothetical protein